MTATFLVPTLAYFGQKHICFFAAKSLKFVLFQVVKLSGTEFRRRLRAGEVGLLSNGWLV